MITGPARRAIEQPSPSSDDVRRQLQSGQASLTEREYVVLQQRFGLLDGRAHARAEISQSLGVSVERIRQIELRALGKLRHPQRGRTPRHPRPADQPQPDSGK